MAEAVPPPRIESHRRRPRVNPRIWHANTCAYPNPKPGRIDDGTRQGFVSQGCDRSSASAGTLGHLHPTRDGSPDLVIGSVRPQDTAQLRFAERDETVDGWVISDSYNMNTASSAC